MMRKRIFGIFLAGLLLVIGLCVVVAPSGHFSFTPPVAHKNSFSANTASYPSRLKVSGNQLVDASGQTVLLKGLMPPDPSQLRLKGKFNREFFQELHDSGAKVIRIPVHPERWEQDPDYLWRYLDPLVTWGGEMEMYVILDLHFIGNVASGAGEKMPDLHVPSKEFTTAFWRQVAEYFKDAPHVLFEIFNEPESISPGEWRQNAQEISSVIRTAGASQPIIIGGVDYSKNLSWVLDQPVVGENIVYAAHIYPSHSAASWDTWFGEVSLQYPVLVTEWGWTTASTDSETAYLVGSENSYGQPFLNYLQEREIGWVACWYDDEWLPAMFEKGFTHLTGYGEFVKQNLPSKAVGESE